VTNVGSRSAEAPYHPPSRRALASHAQKFIAAADGRRLPSPSDDAGVRRAIKISFFSERHRRGASRALPPRDVGPVRVSPPHTTSSASRPGETRSTPLRDRARRGQSLDHLLRTGGRAAARPRASSSAEDRARSRAHPQARDRPTATEAGNIVVLAITATVLHRLRAREVERPRPHNKTDLALAKALTSTAPARCYTCACPAGASLRCRRRPVIPSAVRQSDFRSGAGADRRVTGHRHHAAGPRGLSISCSSAAARARSAAADAAVISLLLVFCLPSRLRPVACPPRAAPMASVWKSPNA